MSRKTKIGLVIASSIIGLLLFILFVPIIFFGRQMGIGFSVIGNTCGGNCFCIGVKFERDGYEKCSGLRYYDYVR